MRLLLVFRLVHSKWFTVWGNVYVYFMSSYQSVKLRLCNGLPFSSHQDWQCFSTSPLSLCSSAAVCTWGPSDSRTQQERRVSGVWLTDQWWAHRERVKGVGQRSGSHGEGESRAGGNRDGGHANEVGWLLEFNAWKRDANTHWKNYMMCLYWSS